MALISWWLSEQIAFQQTKLFCHKQFGRIYIFTATKMDAIEKAFWHPIILGGWPMISSTVWTSQLSVALFWMYRIGEIYKNHDRRGTSSEAWKYLSYLKFAPQEIRLKNITSTTLKYRSNIILVVFLVSSFLTPAN